MARTLCQRKAMLAGDPEAYANLVAKPRFVCLECGRAARRKKHLCKAQRLAGLRAGDRS